VNRTRVDDHERLPELATARVESATPSGYKS
jgi:hypothetical protein